MNIYEQLATRGIRAKKVTHNANPAELYEACVRLDHASISSSGALVTDSGERTGRSPSDKRIVEQPENQHQVWWGDVNMPLRPLSYRINRQRAIDFLNSQLELFVVDGYAGWDPDFRIKVRMISPRPYHALFMRNMLLRLPEGDPGFEEPDLFIINSGTFPADPLTPDVTSTVSINLNLGAQEMVILGSEYAGEMKKGVFSFMHYMLPQQNVLSMHCAANEGKGGDVSLFFGLSGTGKTTLSADPSRRLIGDDEHGWSDHGVFNIEGGCYAKCIHLTREKEPLIYDAIRFGTVLENTTIDPHTRDVDYDDTSITQNTRASYPLESVANSNGDCVGGHPANIVFLTCDAFGVLPPVSRLTPEQARFHFMNGYTAKVAGTEVGVKEPQATFSSCYGAAFLVLPPARYADLLEEKIKLHSPDVWLVNTGWTGGDYEQGHRIDLKQTRAIIDAIHDGSLHSAETVQEPFFGLKIPTECPGVDSKILDPRQTWEDKEAYDRVAADLRERFNRNFEKTENQALQLTSNTSEFHRQTF